MQNRLRFSRLWNQLWTRFPAAAVCSFLCTLSAILSDSSGVFPETPLNALLWIALTAAVTGEMIRERRKLPGWFPWAMAAAGAILGIFLRNAPIRVPIGLILAGIFLCVWLYCGNNPARPGQLGGWFLLCLPVCGLVLGMLCLIGYALESLFSLPVPYHKFILFCWTGFAPWLFLGGLPQEAEESGGFVRRISALLLQPLYMLLLAVLDGYVLKILITWKMPVGEMNGLSLTALCGYGLLAWLTDGTENRIGTLFHRVVPFALLPAVAAQAAGVAIRLDAYGLTSARYAGIAVTLLLLAAVIAGILRKSVSWLPLASGALCLLLLVSPLNVEDVPLSLQEKRLSRLLTANEMLSPDGTILAAERDVSSHDREAILAAAGYISDHNHQPKDGTLAAILAERLNTEPLQDIFGFDDENMEASASFASAFTGYGAFDTDGYAHAEYFVSDPIPEENGALLLLDTPIFAEDLLSRLDHSAGTLTDDRFALSDGRVLKCITLTVSTENGLLSCQFDGWLLSN